MVVERVQQLVSQMILQTTGQCIEPGLDESLIERGWLDSLSAAHLVFAVQDEFGVVLDVSGGIQHLATVRAIADRIETLSQ